MSWVSGIVSANRDDCVQTQRPSALPGGQAKPQMLRIPDEITGRKNRTGAIEALTVVSDVMTPGARTEPDLPTAVCQILKNWYLNKIPNTC